MLTINKTTHFRILDALEIPYVVMNGRAGKIFCLTTDSAEHLFADIRIAVTITDEEIATLQLAMQEAGLPKDWEPVREKIRQSQLDARDPNLPWLCNFVRCNCDLVRRHGFIRKDTGQVLFNPPAFVLLEGIIEIELLLQANTIGVPTGVHMLKQMVEIDLPNDPYERDARFAAEPPEVRSLYDGWVPPCNSN